MSDFDQCLRPVFTERIVRLLQGGRSINLIGGEEAEQERLLEDIHQMTCPETTILLVNMKNYRHTYAGFLQELWAQLGRAGEQPEHLSAFIDRYDGKSGRLFLLLQNFDALLGTPKVDTHYNVAFYNALNYVRNRPNIALLCATPRPHNDYIVFLEGESDRTSWIDLEPQRLPALTYMEIVTEVNRRALPLSQAERALLVDALQKYEHPYALLTYLSDKLLNCELAALSFRKRLRRWLKQFRKDDKKRLLSLKRGLQVREDIRVLSDVTGISSLKGLLAFVSKPVKLLTDILENLAHKGKKDHDE